jgi:hypothetical protein
MNKKVAIFFGNVKDMGVAWGARFELAVQDFKIQNSLAAQGFIVISFFFYSFRYLSEMLF